MATGRATATRGAGAAAARSGALRRTGARLQALLLPAAFLAVWETAGRSGWVSPALVPAPSTILESWKVWIVGQGTRTLNPYSGTWLESVGHSTVRVLEGFAIGGLLGVALGILIGWYRPVARTVDPSIQMIRPIPITAWVPFAIALFGIRDSSALFLIGLGAFFPVVVNTTQGVRDTSRILIRAARMLGASERRLIQRVVVPAALPSIFTGLRLGVGVAWVCVVVAEMVAVKSGLGYVLWDGYYLGRMDIIVAAMVTIGLLGFLSDRLIVLVAERVLRWQSLERHA